MMLKLSDSTISRDVKTFMDAIGDGILIVGKTGIINTTNKAAREMLGYKNAGQIEGQDALNLLEAVDNFGKIITKKNAALFQSIRKGNRVSNEIRQFLRANKKRFWASITTTPIKNGSGTIKGAVIVIRDITEEKQAEEYRQDFADIASHSLRTPLGNVLWANECLLSQKTGSINQRQREYLEESHKTLRSMNTMVNDLLSVSRLPDKRSKPKLEKVCLEDPLEKVIQSYDAYTKAQNLEIVIKDNKEKPHFIKADQKYLFIILQNVIENAIRYAFKKTAIIIEIKKQGKNVIFSCTNEGIGIPKNKQKFIFAKFFRAKNAVDKQGNGTGLGLYITYEMIRLNKGKIWFESVENEKTTFFIQFNSY